MATYSDRCMIDCHYFILSPYIEIRYIHISYKINTNEFIKQQKLALLTKRCAITNEAKAKKCINGRH